MVNVQRSGGFAKTFRGFAIANDAGGRSVQAHKMFHMVYSYLATYSTDPCSGRGVRAGEGALLAGA